MNKPRPHSVLLWTFYTTVVSFAGCILALMFLLHKYPQVEKEVETKIVIVPTEKGDPGDTGAAGATGKTGATGKPGPVGEKGEHGKNFWGK